MPDRDARADLALLIDASQKAAELALPFFRADPKVWDKGEGAGPVTEADLAVDRFLTDHLRSARPDYGWLSEETEDDHDRLSRDHVFIIDPIDGTRAFIAREPSWAHSLAVARGGQIIAAVVLMPARDLLYEASLGGGARRNGQPMTVSPHPTADGATLLAAKPNMDPSQWQDPMPRLERHFRPALAYRLALVAEGRFDAMLSLRPTWEWDVAAGTLLVQEAGGSVSDRTGKAPAFNSAAAQLDGIVGAGACGAALRSALTPASP